MGIFGFKKHEIQMLLLLLEIKNPTKKNRVYSQWIIIFFCLLCLLFLFLSFLSNHSISHFSFFLLLLMLFFLVFLYNFTTETQSKSIILDFICVCLCSFFHFFSLENQKILVKMKRKTRKYDGKNESSHIIYRTK